MAAKSGSSCAKSFLRWLNAVLILGACASVAIILVLRRSPTPWGWAFIVASTVSILSGLLGFSSPANRPCFALHALLVLLSVSGQGLGFLMLFARTRQLEELLKPTTGERETRVLMRANAALFVGMFCVEMQILVVAFSMRLCAAGEYQGLDDDVEACKGKGRRRSTGRRMARVQEEALAKANVAEEMRAGEFNDKIKLKYGQWTDEKEFGS